MLKNNLSLWLILTIDYMVNNGFNILCIYVFIHIIIMCVKHKHNNKTLYPSYTSVSTYYNIPKKVKL